MGPTDEELPIFNTFGPWEEKGPNDEITTNSFQPGTWEHTLRSEEGPAMWFGMHPEDDLRETYDLRLQFYSGHYCTGPYVEAYTDYGNNDWHYINDMGLEDVTIRCLHPYVSYGPNEPDYSGDNS